MNIQGRSTDRVEAILFDLDGTLIDTYELILSSMRYAVKTISGNDHSDEQLMSKVGQPLITQMWDYVDSDEAHEKIMKVYRDHNEIYHDKLASSFDGVTETLQELKQAGYPLGVVTSKRHQPAVRGLALFDLVDYFEFIIGSDDCATHKPDPGPVLYGAKRIGVDPRDCLYVGDSPFDIQAGNAAGAITVAALWGMFPEPVLEAEHPDYRCATIRDLPGLLAS